MAACEGVRGKILLAAQEITFAKVLAGNDKPTRDRGVKRLRKWLTARSEGSLEFSEDDHLTLWKGLFYCMWMSDKPLVQEDLAEQISNLIHCFKKSHQGILFMKCFFQTMAREWFGIDQFRLDKFMMLVRRCVRQLFIFCFNHGWTPKCSEEVSNLFESVLINSPDNALGLVLHVSDIVLEELAKAGGGENAILYIIKPWAKLIGMHHDRRLRQHVVDRVFHHLIRQSNLGIEFQDKFDAWKAAGFPGNSWREMEAVEIDSDENEDSSTEVLKNEKILDPRAGKVDVELPQILFEPEQVSHFLHEAQSKASLLRGRKLLRLLSSQFKQLAEGHYPLGFKKPPGPKQKPNKRKAEGELWEAAEDLLEYETEVIQNEKQHQDEFVKPPKKMKLEKNSESLLSEKDEFVKPQKKINLEKGAVEGFLSKSKKKRLRMKQNLNKAKVKSELSNKKNCENLQGDTNATTRKITPAEKHQKLSKSVSESESFENLQVGASNEHKCVVSPMQQLKKKRQSSEERKSPKVNVNISKRTKKSPLKEVNSNSEIKPIGSPSPKRKKDKVSTDKDCILSADSVSPKLLKSPINSPSTELKSLESISAGICNEDKSDVSVMLKVKKKRQSSEERKSPKLNVEISKKCVQSPMAVMNSNHENKPTRSPSPRKQNASTDVEGSIFTDNVHPQLHHSDLKEDEHLNKHMCSNVTPLKQKNSPVLIKEPDSLRRSLRIRAASKTTTVPSPLKSRSTLNGTKSKKQRLSESLSETSIIGSQVGAVLVQKFESCEVSLATQPLDITPSHEKTPVMKKLKSRKSIKDSTPNKNTSLKLEGSGKKVNIVLNKNMSQGFMEYERAVRNSPDIPFDASKKPVQGVLKPTSVPSPLNPFYKLNKIKL